MSIDDIKSLLGGSSVMDFDGDGYNDLVFPYQNSVTGHWNNADFYIILGSDVVAGNIRKYAFPVKLQSTDRAPLFATLDVNGNGKDDVVCVEQVKKGNYYPCTIVELVDEKNLKTTDVKLILPQNVNEEIEKIYTGDYNNDGLPDLILLYNGGYKIYFNNGGTTVDTRFTESNTKSGTNFGNFWRIQQGDFDGDGLSDFVYNKAGETFLWIAHNNGNGTFTNTKTVDIGVGDHASNKDDSRFALMTYDIDHDGRTDVMVCKAGYVHRGFPKFKNEYTNTQVKWLYSTGSSLKLANSYTKNREDDAKESYIFLGDFDGDGSMELANYGSALNSSSNSFAEKINIYQAGYNLPQVGKITCITDGMGNSKHFQYASATSPTVYKKIIDNPSSNTYPINTYTLPLHVVKKVTSENGSAGNQVTNYRYENFTLHIAGGGMLGFKTMITENVTLNTKDSCITQWNTEFLIPDTIKKSNIVGNSTSTIISNYTISPVGNNYFAYVSNEDVTDLDGNKSSIDTSYDIEKGVITDKTVKNDGDNMYKKVVYSDYQNKCGIWLPKTMVMSQKHADDPVPYTSVTTYSYDDKGNVLTSTANSGTNMALKTTSTYDVYGNVLSSVTTGNGVKAITKYNEYDTSGRFVIKSYTSPASAVNTFTYDLWGNVLTETDATDPANNLTTTYTYDGWGRKQTALQADGTKTTWATGWGVSGSKKYFIMEFTTGKPSVTTWYDKAGNEVLQLSFGPKGISVSKSTSYNSQGQVSCVVNKTGKLTITQNLSYDERGRIDKDTQSSGKSVSYTYGNRSVTSHVAGRSYTKVSDAWGNIIKSVDPVSEVEYRYYSIGKPSSVTTGGATVTMTYDEAGNQLTLSDPDAGITTYTYAADGTLLTQTDGRGVKTTNSYDNLARLASTRIGQSTTVYTYGTTGNEKLRLTMLSSGNNSVEYTHDKYGRVVTEKRHVDGNGTYSFSYSYNSNNQLAKTTYPGGLEVDYQYDGYGFKSQSAIGDKVIYKLESTDGLVSSTSFMGQLTTTRTRNAQGYEINRKITHGSSVVENFDAAYDGVTDNLLSRKRNSGPTETFGYDNLDRLVSVKSDATETMRINYAPNGNILSKTGVGDFTYDENLRPHAVIEVENANGEIPSDALSTTFNDFGKIQMIEDAGKGLRMDLYYGPDQERWCSELSRNGTDVRTTVYAGEYEKITENGTTREYYYLDGNTIVVKENGVFKNFLAFTDNIGSILSVIYEDGAKVFDASYDAWGRQTVTRNTIGLHRGYTGHEMLPEFDIVNMNGRLYDPLLGRFFSPDNFVQMPDNSQNFNRYSYCLNNPLKYTDPSGNLFGIDDAVIAFAVFNMANSMMQAAYEGKSVWKAGAFSLLSSAVTYGIGEAFKGAANTFGNELLRAGAHGLSSGVFAALDGGNFASAFVSGATASGMGSYAQAVSMNTGLMIASTTAMGGAVAWLTGGEFLQGAMNGMMIGAFNHALHDGRDGSTPLKVFVKTNKSGMYEFTVIGTRKSRNANVLATAVGINTIADCAGMSLKQNSGNSTIGHNGRLYLHTAGQHGFYGNQYVSTSKLSTIGRRITKFTGPVGNIIDVHNIGQGIYTDYHNYHSTGYTDGYYTVRATADVVGGCAGAATGIKIGTSVGSIFGGIGAIPGAIIGGTVGGIIGAYGGGWLTTNSVDLIYGR